jgi:hypothetical protein
MTGAARTRIFLPGLSCIISWIAIRHESIFSSLFILFGEHVTTTLWKGPDMLTHREPWDHRLSMDVSTIWKAFCVLIGFVQAVCSRGSVAEFIHSAH